MTENNEMHRLVDLEFNALVEAVLLVIEHEKTLERDTDFMSAGGSKMLHEAINSAKDNMKEFF
tara:strand:+ start:92 stop:280 length:189 start_codon:yes stop_codon:yes gene_type:complete